MGALTEQILEMLGRGLSMPVAGAGLSGLLTAAGGLFRKRRSGLPYGHPFQILVYHRVLPSRDPFAIAPVTSAYFDRQMGILRRHFRPISLETLMGEIDAGEVAPRSVCVTFDDGYADNYQHAFPILKKHGVPATIFLATDFIGTTSMPWHDRVLLAFKHGLAARFSLPKAGLADKVLAGPRDRVATAYQLLDWLKRFSPRERNERIEGIVKACGAPVATGAKDANLMMDWNNVREMVASDVIAFGAHTESHPILSTLSETDMELEIMGSKAVLERELGKPVRLFAYPNGRKGDYTETTRNLLQKADFLCAVTTNPGVNYPNKLDRFEILRRQPWDRSPYSFHSRFLLEYLLA